jgi:hypothetical protein
MRQRTNKYNAAGRQAATKILQQDVIQSREELIQLAILYPDCDDAVEVPPSGDERREVVIRDADAYTLPSLDCIPQAVS